MPIYDPTIPRIPGAPTRPSVGAFDGSMNFNKPSNTSYQTTPGGGVKSRSTTKGGGFANVYVPPSVLARARGASTPKPAAQSGQPAASGAGGGAQQAQPQQPAFNPDAAYNAAMARLGFDRDTSVTDIQRQQGYADVDFNEQLRRWADQNAKDKVAVTEGANDEGLFYSGQLGKRQGELATAYERQVGDLRRDKERADADRAAAIEAINKRYALDSNDAMLAGIDRQVQRDSEAAAAGALAAPVVPSAAQAIGLAPKPKNRWLDAFRDGGHWWYRDENGQKVRLR